MNLIFCLWFSGEKGKAGHTFRRARRRMLISWDTTEQSYTHWDLRCLTFLRYWEVLSSTKFLLPVYFWIRLTLWPLFWLPHYLIIYSSSPYNSLDSTLKKYFCISEKNGLAKGLKFRQSKCLSASASISFLIKKKKTHNEISFLLVSLA